MYITLAQLLNFYCPNVLLGFNHLSFLVSKDFGSSKFLVLLKKRGFSKLCDGS